MTDTAAENIAQIKFESDMGLHGRWAEGLWDQVPLTERLALTNNMESFISALTAAGWQIAPVEPTDERLEAEMRRKGISKDNINWAHYILEARATYKAMLEVVK